MLIIVIIVGIILGILIAQYLIPHYHVMVPPTLENVGKKTYIDENGVRYHYGVVWL